MNQNSKLVAAFKAGEERFGRSTESFAKRSIQPPSLRQARRAVASSKRRAPETSHNPAIARPRAANRKSKATAIFPESTTTSPVANFAT